MRSLTLAARSPQKVGDSVRINRTFGPPVQPQAAVKKQPRLHPQRAVEISPAQRRQEKARKMRQWRHDSGMSRLATDTFVRELYGIKNQVGFMQMGRIALPRELRDLKVTPHALSQFIRHYFVCDRKTRAVSEWLFDCPELQDATIPGLAKAIRGMGIDELEEKDRRKTLDRLKDYLVLMMKNVLGASFIKLMRSRGSDGDRLSVFMKNPDTMGRFYAIVALDDSRYEVIAVYPEGKMNRKRSHRRARQLNHRLYH
ncbi:MAG: hypothetical protein U0487_03720 [Patescibacteria group bacterium]